LTPSAPLATPKPNFDQGNIEENLQPPQPLPDTDMADSAVLPPPFTGKPSKNPSDWFRQFTNYCQYKDLTDQKRMDWFKVLMSEAAAVWLKNLDLQAIRTKRMSRQHSTDDIRPLT